jgi:hypothetical protein
VGLNSKKKNWIPAFALMTALVKSLSVPLKGLPSWLWGVGGVPGGERGRRFLFYAAFVLRADSFRNFFWNLSI